MRRIIFGAMVVLTASVLLLSACAQTPATAAAKLGETVTLSAGQSVTIKGEDMTIKFNKVVSDSRVPAGVNDLWQGQVTSSITITYHGTDYPVQLQQMGHTDSAKQDFFDYVLTHNMSLRPASPTGTADTDYRLTLTVTK